MLLYSRSGWVLSPAVFLTIVQGVDNWLDAFFNKSRLTYFCLVGWLDVLKLPVYSGFTGLCLNALVVLKHDYCVSQSKR